MLPRPALRPLAQAFAARRAFHASAARKGSIDHFFHYPEGPRSNLPFNPLTKFFWFRFYAFFGVAFLTPFASSYWMSVKEG